MITPVGIAGCGMMGAPMLRSLIRSGFDARGFDVRPSAEFDDLAPQMFNDMGGFSDGLKTALTVVRDQPQTESLLFGAQNLVGHAQDLQTLIICSTLSPRYVMALRDRVPAHITLIDAPMSGAEVRAQAGTLTYMLGGEAEALDAHQPLFDAMGAHFHRMGGFGAGMQGKVLNNMLTASSTAMTRLVLSWADEYGLDEATLLQLIHTSSGQNWLASGMDEIEFARKGYETGNSLGILKKDVESALDAAPKGADKRLPELLAQMVAELTPRP